MKKAPDLSTLIRPVVTAAICFLLPTMVMVALAAIIMAKGESKEDWKELIEINKTAKTYRTQNYLQAKINL